LTPSSVRCTTRTFTLAPVWHLPLKQVLEYNRLKQVLEYPEQVLENPEQVLEYPEQMLEYPETGAGV